MKRIRTVKTYVEDSDSDTQVSPLKKPTKDQKNLSRNTSNTDHGYSSSSSESDIEKYLHKPEKLDLNSDFFNTNATKTDKEENTTVAEKNINLSDSESSENEDKPSKPPEETTKKEEPKEEDPGPLYLFSQFQNYTKQIEETKRQVEQLKTKKTVKEKNLDISEMLAAGEKVDGITADDLHSSDFESHDSEQDDWEEIKNKGSQEVQEKNIIPEKGLEIVVDMPDNVRKKKGVDLVAALKRRLNRIRKENQVLVHKVHLLCWIVHGNYINAAINDNQTLAMALSLLPSEQSYPSDRPDLSYLEKITAWYKRTVKLLDKPVAADAPLSQSLQGQIAKKEAVNKKMLAIIYVAILRALGIQARIVISLQVEPLRPPASELHSLSTKVETNGPSTSKKLDVKKLDPISESPKSTPKPEKNEPPAAKPQRRRQSKSESNASPQSELKVEKKPRAKSSETKEAPPASAKSKQPAKASGAAAAKKQTRADVKIAVQPPTPPNKPEKTGKKRVISASEGTSKKSAGRGRSASTESATSVDANQPKRAKSSEGLGSAKPARKPRKSSESASKKLVVEVKNLAGRRRSASTERATSVDASQPKRAKSSEALGSAEPARKRTKSSESASKKLVVEVENLAGRRRSASTESATSVEATKLKSLDAAKPTRKRTNSSDTRKTTAKKLTVKVDGLTGRRRSASTESATSVESSEPKRAKSTESTSKKRGKSADSGEPKRATRSSKKIPQLDGLHDTSDSDCAVTLLQVDGANDDPKKKPKKSPNLKVLKKKSAVSPSKPNLGALKLKSPKKQNFSDSDSDFEPAGGSPFEKQMKRAAPDLKKLQKIKSGKNDVTSDVVQLVKKRISEHKRTNRSRLANVKRRTHESESDSDYVPEEVKKKQPRDSEDDFAPRTKVKRRIPARPVLSDDDEKTKKKKRIGNDVWVEVFLEAEEKWISVDVVYGQVHCVKEIAKRATHPITYVLSWDNNSNIKDITLRYCQNFNTVTRKLRIDQKWWTQTLRPYVGKQTARDKEEDEDLARQQLDQPLPKSIAEYKNHPLYALRRHLLKFEAIYPPEPVTLGFIRGEAVYPRGCVFTLHSRDIWLKQAKVVKRGEEPYKIVKARPKWDKLSNKAITDLMLEIFGPWQVEDYDPPTAEGGIVPRNAYGNVDLFKACMLPKGCVHLKLPGLSRVAKRLDIDCAQAVVGFDFHNGWSVPVLDGFVVCKEFEEQLISAWEVEQEEQEKKEQDKLEKRVYGNWKRLIKGLLIRERLKAKYDFGNPSASTSNKDKQKKVKGPSFCTKKK